MNLVHIGTPVTPAEHSVELNNKIRELVYEYADVMTVSQAVGILHVCAYELMRDAEAEL
jgi:hypothetical protein